MSQWGEDNERALCAARELVSILEAQKSRALGADGATASDARARASSCTSCGRARARAGADARARAYTLSVYRSYGANQYRIKHSHS